MFGQRTSSTAIPTAPTNDPNELMQRIDRTTTQMFHWVRAGMVVVILLLILVVIIG